MIPNSQFISPGSSLVTPHLPCSCFMENAPYALQHNLIIPSTLQAHLFSLLSLSPLTSNLYSYFWTQLKWHFLKGFFLHPHPPNPSSSLTRLGFHYNFSSRNQHFLQLYFYHFLCNYLFNVCLHHHTANHTKTCIAYTQQVTYKP